MVPESNIARHPQITLSVAENFDQNEAVEGFKMEMDESYADAAGSPLDPDPDEADDLFSQTTLVLCVTVQIEVDGLRLFLRHA